MNIASLVEVKVNPKIPRLAPGDTVKVHTKIIEGEKERTQVFQGIIIKQRHTKSGVSFTVRHVAYGVGVERTFPAQSPLVEKVEIVRHGKVRRAKLYYLRGLSGKASRIKERRADREQLLQEQAAHAEAQPAPELGAEAPAAPEATQPVAQAQPVPETSAQPPKAKAETPKAEAPKVEAAKAETPKAEAPKAKAPKAEAPKTEDSKAPAPKTEGQPESKPETKA